MLGPRHIIAMVEQILQQALKNSIERKTGEIKALAETLHVDEHKSSSYLRFMRIPAETLRKFYIIHNRLPEVNEIKFLRAVDSMDYVWLISEGIDLAKTDAFNNYQHDESKRNT